MSKHSSGTYAPNSERHGPGPVAGAGETSAKGPGNSKSVRGAGLKPDMYPSDKEPKAQKNVPNRTRGREEDGD
jgi:hypothetical protein